MLVQAKGYSLFVRDIISPFECRVMEWTYTLFMFANKGQKASISIQEYSVIWKLPGGYV